MNASTNKERDHVGSSPRRDADDSRSHFHTVHHKNTNFNFSQYLPLWDHLGATRQDPARFFRRQGRDG